MQLLLLDYAYCEGGGGFACVRVGQRLVLSKIFDHIESHQIADSANVDAALSRIATQKTFTVDVPRMGSIQLEKRHREPRLVGQTVVHTHIHGQI